MALTDAQQERLDQRFKLYDTNGDGRIDRSDLHEEALRIVQAFGEPEGSLKAQQLLNAYPMMFDHLVRKGGHGAGASLTKEQFRAIAEQEILQHGQAGFASVLRPSIQAMVALCDTDGDGEVNPDEFDKWINAISPGIDAKAAFQAIDTDGNGQLTIDELVAAVGRYHAGETNAPLLGV
ncbi:EF-hand domain-containing protein [Streptomyces alanosinicus]|uniref:Calcium-binding protein n=1 Tax=Streptomyces alanosinicus TaxID=68171 RepID=A0A918YQ18_9ACTN|nr:EF-hand domain-containing protein [Streptomyces alanosinicus]GHE09516.1 calcium-binding protein [Streptomyces alanosinicus]